MMLDFLMIRLIQCDNLKQLLSIIFVYGFLIFYVYLLDFRYCFLFVIFLQEDFDLFLGVMDLKRLQKLLNLILFFVICRILGNS